MDYILKKFEASINLADEKDKAEYMRARIEYLFYFLLGYAWNKFNKNINAYDLIDFSKRLGGSLTLGAIIKYIKNFDKDGDIVNNADALKEYNKYRIDNLGHGFVFDTDIKEDKLENLYKNLCSSISILNEKIENKIVVVEKKQDNYYRGYSISSKEMFPKLWMANESILPKIEKLPVVLFSSDKQEYHMLTPFIHVYRTCLTDLHFYIFFQTTSNESAEFTNLFENTSEKTSFNIPNTYQLGGFREASLNTTIINVFQKNYKKFIDNGMIEKISSFLKNRNSVTAVISGNGGIGKTACVQKICDNLMEADTSDFSFIIFASAKDRRFNTESEEIETIEKPLKDFYGVMNTIHKTIIGSDANFSADSKTELDDFILSITENWNVKESGKILFIVDDFETFNDEDKRKITDFFDKLEIDKHKAIITTRNVNLISSGTKIVNNPFDMNGTVKFVREKIKENHNEYIRSFDQCIQKDGNKERLHKATEGVPLFMLLWINIFLRGHDEVFSDEHLSSKEKAREFLVGRTYSYLSDNARILYSALSVITDNSRRFNREILRKCCAISIDANSFDGLFTELIDMNIIEKQDDTIYRIYNECFLNDMDENFKNKLEENTRNSIRCKFNQTYNGRSTDLPEVAMFKGAETAAKQADYPTATERYRQIINDTKISLELRCKALFNLLVLMYSSTESVETMHQAFEEYDKKFPDLTNDPDLLNKYIFFVWPKSKKITYQMIENYFAKVKDIDYKNLVLFSLCATYYAKYSLKYNKINPQNLEDAFSWCNKIYLFVSKMSDKEFARYITSQTKQNVKTCLLQAFDISKELSKMDVCSDISYFFCKKFPYEEVDLKHFGDFRVYFFRMLKTITNTTSDNIKAFKGEIQKSVKTNAILHISKCASHRISPEDMNKFNSYLQKNTLAVKIIGESEKGYEVSLIDVKPSFDDIISTI